MWCEHKWTLVEFDWDLKFLKDLSRPEEFGLIQQNFFHFSLG